MLTKDKSKIVGYVVVHNLSHHYVGKDELSWVPDIKDAQLFKSRDAAKYWQWDYGWSKYTHVEQAVLISKKLVS